MHAIASVCFFLVISCFSTTGEKPIQISHVEQDSSKLVQSFSLWPSFHNGIQLKFHKREVNLQTSPTVVSKAPGGIKNDVVSEKPVLSTVSEPPSDLNKADPNTTVSSTAKPGLPEVDFNKPGVLKRALIVFGSFGLLALAYLIFYRKRGFKSDSGLNSTQDGPQFRYGMLESDERSDQLEFTRMMETDDDDEDDLEIFDLSQNKKPASFKQPDDMKNINDEMKAAISDPSQSFSDTPLQTYSDKNKDQLLLDIDDKTSETLINLNASSSKINN